MLSLPSGHTITADEFNVATGNCEGITGFSAVDTTTSATYVNTAATTSFSFTKILTATRLRIDLSVVFFVTVNDTSTMFGVNVNGTDYDLAQQGSTISAGVELTTSGFVFVPAGLAPGTYTIQLRWKRTAGTGTCSRAGNGFISLFCTETG